MTDTLHTNEERIEKIRCLLDTVTSNSAWLLMAGGESILEDLAASRECLDALKQFMADHNTLDCI